VTVGIIESVQQYDLNIPPGGAQSIDVTGDRVQFLSALDPFAQIEVRPNFAQGNITLRPGQGFRFSEPVQRWVVYNRGTVPLSGYLLIGSGDFFDQRISGDVNVIDNAKARTLQGQAFLAYVSHTTLNAANRPVLHIRNPVGSARNVSVLSVLASASVAGFIGVGYQASALATAAGAVQSKLAGGANGVTTMSRDEMPGYPYTSNILGANVDAGGSVLMSLREPIVLPPGNGLGISLSNLGAGNLLTVTMELVEEPI